MKYKIVSSREAEKTVKRLNANDFKAINLTVESLEDNPLPEQSGTIVSMKNSGKNYYKIRVRDYRIIYWVDKENETVYIDRIARRNEKTYKDL